ncbi:3-oxoacyl-ACP synthase [Streptomyces rimosus subsp. rimosus]|nr:3-oxoacyl-ACP synthase [Streptomyces rimosus subsp. rimosus]KOT33063.1 3-oxoacyl-ACP synthase [Streptomyces sp. NRRL WC-3701]KOT54252.1 3-oxoacyl-ACP synthase [Streptomyces rimosus subsp. rimosus]KOT55653.1 3-oxoacyl-ACP synthase [Streptomyces rimosus subsp. rimosus]KOT70583.1 3-oxoacyl-ACP synthase [Streptomyces rimosus subsp. rimosus]
MGGDSASTWEGMLAGRSGVSALTQDWAADLPVRIAASAAVDPGEVIPRAQARKLDRSAQLALIAAREAWADAGFDARAGEDASVDPDRLGAVIASGIGGVTTLLNQYDILREKGSRRVSPHTVPMLMPNSPSANVGLEVNARAGVHTPVSACASGAEAIGYAIEMIRTGRADVVVAGGTEAAIHPLPIAAFGNMMAMSKDNDDPQGASRPYDADRNGFVLGEGSGVIVLESADHAAKRGARIYAEAVGQGISADSHDIVQPEPSGNGIAHALQNLLANTDLKPAEIAHVNAHATSTPLGDLAELKALRKVFGTEADHMAISATKSMTGHLLGGAGGVETVASILALYHRVAPPTINIQNLDPEADADIVRDVKRELPAEGTIAALNDSFGFGGHNVVLAFRTV